MMKGTMIFRKNILKTAAILVLVVSVLALPGIAKTTSSATTVSTGGIKNVLIYNVVGLISPTPSYITVNEIALNLLSKPLPSQLTLTLVSSYNGGAPNSIFSCTVSTHINIL